MGKGKKGGLRIQEQSRETEVKLQIMQLAKRHPCLGREMLNICSSKTSWVAALAVVTELVQQICGLEELCRRQTTGNF
jgi:hypothetical protein